MKPPRPTNLPDLGARLETVEANVELVRKAVEGLLRPPPMRAELQSVHEFDADVDQLRKTLRDRVKDDSRFDSTRARAIAQDAVATAKRDDKAALWDAVKHGMWKVLFIIVGAVVALLLSHFGVVRP